MPREIIWIGAGLAGRQLKRAGVPNIAARRWQHGLQDGLSNCGWVTAVVSYELARVWPRGDARIGGAAGSNGEEICYWNMPIFRPISLAIGFIVRIHRLTGKLSRPILVCYNTPFYALISGIWYRLLGRRWVVIVADVPSYTALRIAEKWATGVCFLSWGAYKSSRSSFKFHLDGGVQEARPAQRDAVAIGEIKRFGYTGTLTRYGGVELLLQAFALIDRRDVELWISGVGDDAEVKRASANDPRIHWCGILSEDELEKLCHKIDVFVNPRPDFLEENKNNFPSKLLQYLSTGRPVVTTWTEGLHPCYRDLTLVPSGCGPDKFAEKMLEAINLDPWRRSTIASITGAWITTERLWSIQGRRFGNWLESLSQDSSAVTDDR